jgi:hypothetical protein
MSAEARPNARVNPAYWIGETFDVTLTGPKNYKKYRYLKGFL